MRAYLAGPIEAASDLGVPWRKRITPKLVEMEIEVCDPCAIEVEKMGMEVSETVEDLSKYKRSGRWDRFKEIMEQIITTDIRGVGQSDLLVACMDPKVLMGGTVVEFYEAYRKGKPIYAVCYGPISEVNSWWLGLILLSGGQIFSSFSKLLEFVKEKYGGER